MKSIFNLFVLLIILVSCTPQKFVLSSDYDNPVFIRSGGSNYGILKPGDTLEVNKKANFKISAKGVSDKFQGRVEYLRDNVGGFPIRVYSLKNIKETNKQKIYSENGKETYVYYLTVREYKKEDLSSKNVKNTPAYSLDQESSQPISSMVQESNSSKGRLALVIGNGKYSVGPLANPENDAKDMKNALEENGFTVLKFENLNYRDMKRAIDQFGMELKNYDEGLFFYAGHGIQYKGSNYLIPIDAQLKSEIEIEYDCIPADRVLMQMEGSESKVNIIILDACRNNPFERSWSRSTASKGLAFMTAPKGTVIAYATSPGSTAFDGAGRNGLYTSALLQCIYTPNITIEQMFKNVRNIVLEKSGQTQIPWESTSLTGDFYFIRE